VSECGIDLTLAARKRSKSYPAKEKASSALQTGEDSAGQPFRSWWTAVVLSELGRKRPGCIAVRGPSRLATSPFTLQLHPHW
jgi:hypothetical protein